MRVGRLSLKPILLLQTVDQADILLLRVLGLDALIDQLLPRILLRFTLLPHTRLGQRSSVTEGVVVVVGSMAMARHVP